MQLDENLFFEEVTGTAYNFEWLEFWLTLWWIQGKEYTPTTDMFKVFVELARKRKREERGRV